MFVQYLRQCIQHPPPNFLPQSQQCLPSHSAGSQGALRHSVPSSLYAARYTGDVAKLNVQSPEGASSSSQDACRLLSRGPVQCRQVGTGSVVTRSFSEPLDDGKYQRESAVQCAVRENGITDMLSSDLVHTQKTIDSAEDLSLGDRKDKSPESLGSQADLVYRCAWTTTPRDSCQDSGCMSDLSSGGPSATVSPHQSPMNDPTTNEQIGEHHYALSKHLGELELDHSGDKQQEVAGDSVQRGAGVPVPVTMSVQTRTGAPSVPRYVRPMREIPPRFRRLLAAEADRVVRLCHRLNGSPLYSATTSNDAARQPTSDSRATSTNNNQPAYVDKPLADQTSSSLIYVTAQSSGLPVYQPASCISEPLNGCSNASVVEPMSFVVPIGVPDASLQSCGNGLPTAPETLPPSTPMMLANPIFYYPSAALPPPDAGSPFSYVIQTPGCPVQTGGQQSVPGYVRNAQSDHINVAADAAAVGVFQSATMDGCSSYCYNAPCPEILPCSSLQMMQA